MLTQKLKIFISTVLLMIIALTAASAYAQNNNPTDLYKIELIVFTHPSTLNAASNVESNSSDPTSVLTPQLNEENLKRSNATTLLPYDNLAPQQNFRLLPPQDLSLNKEAKRINNKPGYQVISHIAWLQAIPSSRRAKAVNITDEQLVDVQLLGSVTLSKSRYINFSTNLMYNYTYYLKEARRMKSGELNYLDGPHLGLLVKIEPIKESA